MTTREFFIQCDAPKGEDRARYCVVSVDLEPLLRRLAKLDDLTAEDPGLSGLAAHNGFRVLWLDGGFPHSKDCLSSEDDEECPLSEEVQETFDAHRVAEVPEGTLESLKENMAGFLSEVEVEDDKILMDSIGFQVMTTLNSEIVVRSWCVTWDCVPEVIPGCDKLAASAEAPN